MGELREAIAMWRINFHWTKIISLMKSQRKLIETLRESFIGKPASHIIGNFVD